MTYSTNSLYILQGILFLLQLSYVNTNEVELRKSLFLRRYDQKVCPEAGITKVHTNLILLQIESVNEKEQVVTSNIQLTCAWCDPFMTWNASRFNISELSVDSESLWTPDVVLVNSADEKYSRHREHYAVILRNDGYVRFMFQDLWKTICKVRSTYFPFDQQHCTIIIRSGSHDSQSIKFIQRKRITGKSFIRGEWELIDSYTEITDERVSDFGQVDYSLVRFTLILKRNHLYYLIKIIVPFTLVSFITLFTFLLPPQTGEKLTLNVTILLSLVIYLQLLSEHIPKSDDETPILTLFCNANFFLVFLSCIMTVYILYLYYRPSTSNIARVPSHMKIIFLDYLSPLVYCNVDKHYTIKQDKEKIKPRRISSIEDHMYHLFTLTTPMQTANQQAIELLKLLHQIKSHIRTQWLVPLNISNEYQTGTDISKADNQQRLDEWQHVAIVLDRLFFLLFVIAMPCTVLLLVSAHSSAGHSFRSNLTNITTHIADATCNLTYKPMIT